MSVEKYSEFVSLKDWRIKAGENIGEINGFYLISKQVSYTAEEDNLLREVINGTTASSSYTTDFSSSDETHRIVLVKTEDTMPKTISPRKRKSKL